MKSVLRMTDRLKAELPEMLEEHKAVVAALKKLIAAAKAENQPEHARFAEKLMLHAQTEEEVLSLSGRDFGGGVPQSQIGLRLRAENPL